MIKTLALAASFALLSSAASAFSLVGTWNCGPANEPNFTLNAELTYKKNGKSNHTLIARGDIGDDDVTVNIKVWGTWTFDGTTLNEQINRHKLQSVIMNGQKIKTGPEWDGIAASLADGLSSSDVEDLIIILPKSKTLL